MRLNAFLARAGVASRRGADQLIKAGRVYVNGQIGQLNDDVSDADDVKINSRRVSSQKLRYVLLHKPKGYVTTLKDPQGRRTVNSLIDITERIVPVGRLDYDTTGALLLTNDGDLAHQLMHPSFEVDKIYEADVQGKIIQAAIIKLKSGVMLEDGEISPAKVKQISDHKIRLTIHEGRNHQVKRMLAAVGLPVVKLHRSQYGPLKVNNLAKGAWRELEPSEIAELTNLGK